jgi:hypothetical protein
MRDQPNESSQWFSSKDVQPVRIDTFHTKLSVAGVLGESVSAWADDGIRYLMMMMMMAAPFLLDWIGVLADSRI